MEDTCVGPDKTTDGADRALSATRRPYLIPDDIAAGRAPWRRPLAGLEWGAFFLRLTEGPLRPRLVPIPVLVRR